MFTDRQDQDVITVVMKSGETFTGSYMTQAGMHFVGTKAGKGDLIGKVEGPIDPSEVERVEVLKSRDDVLEDRRDRALGERLPGREPVTRDDFEYRLERLAKAMVSAEGMRRTQLSRQFDELADTIALAKPKRAWMIAAAHWSLRSNEPPRLVDLWSSDVASPSLMRRPSPKDFDPDPIVRKTRDRLPPEIVADPSSVPNMLRRLRAADLKAVIALAGDPPWERAIIQVDLAPGRSGRFSVDGRRVDGEMEWTLKWAGNDSNAGRKHQRRALGIPEYAVLKSLVAEIKPNPTPVARFAP
ncbi:hypothetical protein OIU34_24020 [Pararhizobium sp. BT-229]|uniref:hypothetical protein n=1 Tax=Pararhizobium sp. BT-229 TaxID=2986923 RepID=UPI0021F6FDA0|nr:hypothetical protein [Pararhizobium sp. BT-229]MCV9964966.1 hypothetical protein [Pararhizobium sp. BT-229]